MKGLSVLNMKLAKIPGLPWLATPLRILLLGYLLWSLSIGHSVHRKWPPHMDLQLIYYQPRTDWFALISTHLSSVDSQCDDGYIIYLVHKDSLQLDMFEVLWFEVLHFAAALSYEVVWLFCDWNSTVQIYRLKLFVFGWFGLPDSIDGGLTSKEITFNCIVCRTTEVYWLSLYFIFRFSINECI
jgi:hypothetical protein